MVRIDDILAHDVADLRGTREVLVAVGRQRFSLNIGEAQIVQPAPS